MYYKKHLNYIIEKEGISLYNNNIEYLNSVKLQYCNCNKLYIKNYLLLK